MPARTAYRVLLAGSIVWGSAVVMAPLLQIAEIYQFFSWICHQNPSRSWHLGGEPLAVCIRCAAIYLGFIVSLILGWRADNRWLKGALAASLVEFVLARLMFDSALLRALTGLALGASAAPFIRIGLEQMIEDRFARPRQGEIHGSM